MRAPTADRYQLLDALRGFALFGVVWSNFAGHSYWFMLPAAEKALLPGAAFDDALEWFHGVFIEGKFYSIFSLLFGIGFGLFLDKGRTGHWRFVWRMVVLLGIGWLHLRYIWEGDILLLYAALGLLLPLFRRVPDRVLPWTAAVLILSPIAFDGAKVLTQGAFDPSPPPLVRLLDAEEARLIPLVGDAPGAWARYVPEGGFAEWQSWLRAGWAWRVVYIIQSNRIPKVFGLFLLGLWVARKGLYRDPEAWRPLLQRTLRWGLLVGLPMNVLMYWGTLHMGRLPDAEGLVRTTGYALGVVPLALAYAAGFTLLWMRPRQQERLALLVPMGRMALTNYLGQSFIGVLLFTGMGLGLGAQLSALGFEAIAITVFILQLLLSHWWMAHFRYGPFEWLWRCLTYGKVMPLR